ncbi:hypothetical protein [Roseinatronobacter alkalisoli]|uniref:DUF1795 domain-containing protein n=1 Tax=Roseinatronobacter alkalisoli TaxID=3028235 RepID=A0ABT5T8P1_9RHOB|nr:hypothetical protein [Roseinatronobacter sp. HJB301]MDD7971075.1 hypothetical protein [Roseinatronobacter sp. HJB301]
MRQFGRMVRNIGMILPMAFATAADEMDLSDISTPGCAVSGLAVSPPAPWLNAQISGLPEQMSGCQMMRTDDDEHLVGIIRILSVQTGPGMSADEARERVIAFESLIWRDIGFEVTDRLWLREDVPVHDRHDEGFSSGSAVGLAAVIQGTQLPQEIHVLFFSRLPDNTHYVISLLTPSGPDATEIYAHNLEDYSRILNSLTLTSDGSGE